MRPRRYAARRGHERSCKLGGVEPKTDARLTSERALRRFLTRTGRRVLAFKLVRGLCFGAGISGLLMLACALLVGPSIGVLGAALSWSGLLLSCVVSSAVGVGRLDELTGPRRALLLMPHDPRLAQRVRSAAELAERPNGSPELLTEMLTSVSTELATLPLAQLVPRPRFWGRMVLGSLAAWGLAAYLLATREDVGSGLYALTHPVTDPTQRDAKGLWISHLHARITAPAQQGGSTHELLDPDEIEVAEGSVIELWLESRVAIERALLKLGDRSLPFLPPEEKNVRLTLTAESSGVLRFLARVGDTWVEDAAPHALIVEQDQPPEVTLEAPLSDVNAAADEPVPFVYRAQDDHGLSSLELVLELGPGRQRRVRLVGLPEGSATREHEGNADVVPAAYGVRTGQTMAVWVEARDRDAFGGPNVGRSPVRTITVGETHEGRGIPVELLERARDSAIDTLAVRLEAPLPTQKSEAEDRAASLAKNTRSFVRTLGALAKSYEGAQAEGPTTLSLRDMLRRISRLLRDERSASDSRDMREPRRADEALVREFEEDVLWLSDLLGHEKLDNAEKAIERLNATRARMQKLLEELKKTGDPARKAELLAELARARAELGLLAQRLTEAQRDVPADFANLEALAAEAKESPLDQIEDALKRGDLAAAEKALAQLDSEMQNLAKGVQQGSDSYASARFAPRNAAIERARGELAELSKSQKDLANETGRIAEKARARSEEDPALKAENKRLEERAEQLERRVRRMSDRQLHSSEAESRDSAGQRLRDARDALRQQNPGEARSMAMHAADDLESLASELMMDARMFPGPDGKKLDQAKSAQAMAEDASKLAQDIEQNLPNDSSNLSEEESEALKQKAPGQRGLSEKADGLAQDMRNEGPPGMADGLSRSSRSMKKAASALEKGNVREAEAHQRDAAERLNELNEQLQRQSQAGRPESGEGGEREGAGSDHDERVAIPQNGQDARRKELRRRVLDARRADPPSAFERAVDRYYQEILR